MLLLENVHTYYGNVHALKGISLNVDSGELVCLIGSNGAGKSTTLNTISGVHKPRQGQVIFDGKRIDPLPVYEIAKRGVSQVPEGRRVFRHLTVSDNLKMGAYMRDDPASIRRDMEQVITLFPRLRERQRQLAGTLSGGEQQMLAIGRALMARPRLLLLDEPSMSLAPILVREVFQAVQEINQGGGITTLLVEQNAQIALSIADRGYVLDAGNIVLEGIASGLLEDPQVQAAYFGEVWRSDSH